MTSLLCISYRLQMLPHSQALLRAVSRRRIIFSDRVGGGNYIVSGVWKLPMTTAKHLHRSGSGEVKFC